MVRYFIIISKNTSEFRRFVVIEPLPCKYNVSETRCKLHFYMFNIVLYVYGYIFFYYKLFGFAKGCEHPLRTFLRKEMSFSILTLCQAHPDIE